jgi:hypothetical protein
MHFHQGQVTHPCCMHLHQGQGGDTSLLPPRLLQGLLARFEPKGSGGLFSGFFGGKK